MKNLGNFYKVIGKKTDYQKYAYIKDGFLIGSNGFILFEVHLSLFDCKGIEAAEGKGLDHGTLKALANSKCTSIIFEEEGVKMLATQFKYAGELLNGNRFKPNNCPIIQLPDFWGTFENCTDFKKLDIFSMDIERFNILCECFPRDLRSKLTLNFSEVNVLSVNTNNPLCHGLIICE